MSSRRALRVVFLNPTGRIGGAEAALIELVAGLRERHPEWSLAAIVTDDGPLAARARALGVIVRVLPFPASLARTGEWGHRRGRWPRLALAAQALGSAWQTVGYLRRLRHALIDLAPDVLHTNGLKMHLLGAWARPRGGPALVWHMHDYTGRRPVSARLLRLSAHRCRAAIANSASVARDLRRTLADARVPIHPIWNAVDLARLSPGGPALDLDQVSGMPPAPPGVVRVGLVATFARWKGHDTFLNALALLPPSVSWRGYVVGGPVYDTAGSQTSEQELREVADAVQIGSRLGFAGFVPDIAPVMRALDIVVHASTEPEPFGLVIAEAMACGRAVVVSDTGGARELVTPGVDALTHAAGDAEALAGRLVTLASDAALRHRIGAAGRRTAERQFSRARMTDQVTAVYEGLVAHRRAATAGPSGSDACGRLRAS